jgi:hypothetical protein
MSRKRRHQHHGNKSKQAQKPACPIRYTVSLAEWKRFEKFKSTYSQIDDALSDLQENWAFHVQYLTEEHHESEDDYVILHNNLRKVCDLIRGLEIPSKKTKKQWYTPKNVPKEKYGNMVAEIIIEDISDGKV